MSGSQLRITPTTLEVKGKWSNHFAIESPFPKDSFPLILYSILASQMWCLARMLPLVIGDLVPENEPHWEHFLCLLQIEEIVFAQRTTVQLAAYLSVLVDSYLREYTSLYEKPVTPKQHYMVHYPQQIIK